MTYLEQERHRSRQMAKEARWLLVDVLIGIAASGLLAGLAAAAQYWASH